MLPLIILLAILILLVYIVFISHYAYWKKRGVPHPPFSYFFGNIGDSLTLKRNLILVYDEIYNNYPSLGYVGFYKLRQPGIILRDPEIIKEVVSKSVSSFHSNDVQIDESIDPIITKNPFFLTGEKWKKARNQLTPCFTSKQMKTMLPLMDLVGKNLVKYLETNSKCLDSKVLSSKFTTDSVASCAFGLDANSFKDTNADFRKMVELIVSPSFFVSIRLLCVFILPILGRVLRIKAVPDVAANYFTKVISETLKFRKANNYVRGDFLDAMLEYKRKYGDDVFSDMDVTGHTVSFLADGVETSAIVLSYALYELAANPDMQEKLRDEIDSVMKNHGGVLEYDSIQEMTYLEQFVCETMRKYPAAPMLIKRCTQTFSFPPPDGKGAKITIEPNTSIIIPIYSLHHDPKYFSDPERFDPERFSEENKERLTKYTYLPFGEGPRACLGQRFGTTQLKVALANVLSNFEIKVNSKTKEPLEIDPVYTFLNAKGGMWLDFHKR